MCGNVCSVEQMNIVSNNNRKMIHVFILDLIYNFHKNSY